MSSLATPTEIAAAARALAEGRAVVFPTETVYGLGADARRAEAAARIFEIKGRPSFNPLIVHLGDADWLPEVAREVPEWARRLAQAFWPGPLTLVLPKTALIPDLVTAGRDTVAVRVPQHPVAGALLAATGFPLAAPSANRFTRLSPTRVEHAREQLGDVVAAYLDGGPCPIGLESTIVGWVDGAPALLRPGGLPTEAIETVIGGLRRPGEDGPVLAPGMLKKHYSPRTPLHFGEAPAGLAGRLGLVTLTASAEDRARFPAVAELSPGGDLREAAANLFAALRRLEDAGLDAIVARPVPDTGLGCAINDRLRRAGG